MSAVFPDFNCKPIPWWQRAILWWVPWKWMQDDKIRIGAKCFRGRIFILRIEGDDD